MDQQIFNRELMQFIDSSPTPFHGVSTLADLLNRAGFERLRENKSWQLQPGSGYYVVHNGSSIVAFTLGHGRVEEHGFRILGAHTDSPCLKVKPNADVIAQGYMQVGVEIYGGVLLNPWFDRDLSLAGRITYLDDSQRVQNALLDFARPIAVIPSLAIHLNREANTNKTVNPQKELLPLLMQLDKGSDGLNETERFKSLLLQQALSQGIEDIAQVLDYEMSFYDFQKASYVGMKNDFIASARLDNLLSCYVGLKALLAQAADDGQRSCTSVLVCNDHEEIGSVSSAGAQGPLLESVLKRISGTHENYVRAIASSMLVSADNAHGVHPNYNDRHDANHGPILNQGPVIKINANQRYASNSETSGMFRNLCSQCGVPVQSFVVRSDMACGSTIGPITAAELGIRTVDVGVPTFAMHSIRELSGASDAFGLAQVIEKFYCSEQI